LAVWEGFHVEALPLDAQEQESPAGAQALVLTEPSAAAPWFAVVLLFHAAVCWPKVEPVLAEQRAVFPPEDGQICSPMAELVLGERRAVFPLVRAPAGLRLAGRFLAHSPQEAYWGWPSWHCHDC